MTKRMKIAVILKIKILMTISPVLAIGLSNGTNLKDLKSWVIRSKSLEAQMISSLSSSKKHVPTFRKSLSIVS